MVGFGQTGAVSLGGVEVLGCPGYLFAIYLLCLVNFVHTQYFSVMSENPTLSPWPFGYISHEI